MLKHIYRWLQDKNFFKIFALFATLIVVFLSLKPPSQNPQSWTFLYLRGDLFLHFICYFVMTFLYLFAFYTQNNSLSKSALISLALGFVLELIQLITFF